MSDEYWKAHIFDEGIFGVKFDDCHSVGWDIEGLCPDCEKYMCLIAAAPEMLEALEKVEWELIQVGYGEMDYCCPWCHKYKDQEHSQDCIRRHAIAKAKGESL